MNRFNLLLLVLIALSGFGCKTADPAVELTLREQPGPSLYDLQLKAAAQAREAGHHESALELVESALGVARRTSKKELEQACYPLLAQEHLALAQPKLAAHYYLLAGEESARARHDELLKTAADSLSKSDQLEGAFQQAEVAVVLARRLKLDPGPGRLLKGRILLKKGDTKAASELLSELAEGGNEAAKKALSEFAGAQTDELLFQADEHLKAEKYAMARVVLAQAEKLDISDDQRAQISKLRGHYFKKLLERAKVAAAAKDVAALNQVLGHLRSLVEGAKLEGGQQGEWLALEGKAASLQGDPKAAAAYLERAVVYAPTADNKKLLAQYKALDRNEVDETDLRSPSTFEFPDDEPVPNDKRVSLLHVLAIDYEGKVHRLKLGGREVDIQWGRYDTNESVSLTIKGGDERYSLSFKPPDGQKLKPGLYQGTHSFSRSQRGPELDFSGFTRVDGEGRFKLREFRASDKFKVEAVAVDFYLYEPERGTYLYGKFRHHSKFR